MWGVLEDAHQGELAPVERVPSGRAVPELELCGHRRLRAALGEDEPLRGELEVERDVLLALELRDGPLVAAREQLDALLRQEHEPADLGARAEGLLRALLPGGGGLRGLDLAEHRVGVHGLVDEGEAGDEVAQLPEPLEDDEESGT